jgi:hypothetical protein
MDHKNATGKKKMVSGIKRSPAIQVVMAYHHKELAALANLWRKGLETSSLKGRQNSLG